MVKVKIMMPINCNICFLADPKEVITLRYNFITMKKIIAPLVIIVLILAHIVLRFMSANAFILHDRSEGKQEIVVHNSPQFDIQQISANSPYRPSMKVKPVNY